MKHDTLSTVLLSVSLLAATQVAPAQETALPKAPPKLILEPGEHELSDLIDRSARYLQRNYLYNQTEMATSTFTLQAGLAMDKTNCEDFVSQIAYTKGFAMTPVNESLEVFEFINMRGQDRARVFMQATVMTPDEVQKYGSRYIAVTTTMNLKHIDAARASQQLRPFFAMSGSHGALSFTALSSRSLVLSGFAPQVARAMRMIGMADLADPSQKPPQRVRKLK